MRNFAKTKSKIWLLNITFLSVSCNHKNATTETDIDLLGDKKPEKVLVESNLNKNYIKDINIINDNKKEKIISILPMKDSTFIDSDPKIENIYLQANNIQTKEKGLRILIRNTDLIPDCLSIDLIYKKQWIIERFILSNTNPQDSLSIIEKNINKSLENEFGSERVFDPKAILQKYFNK